MMVAGDGKCFQWVRPGGTIASVPLTDDRPRVGADQAGPELSVAIRNPLLVELGRDDVLDVHS
jgi:hypothetical protein